MSEEKIIDENDLVRKLLYESINFSGARAYKDGFLLSVASIIYYSVNSLIKKSTQVLDFKKLNPKVVYCFWQFENEKNAILLEKNRDQNCWVDVNINPRQCKGLEWRKVFWTNPFLIIKFFYIAKKNLGCKSLRSFAHGYIGYLVYRNLMRVGGKNIKDITILTANMVSPLSVAINEYGQSMGYATCYLEHAMTPKPAIHGVEYSRYLIRSSHTKKMLSELGVDESIIYINNKYKYDYQIQKLRKTHFEIIGVAINDEDNPDEICKLIFNLVRGNYKVHIRIHDADIRFKLFKKMANKFGVKIESAKSRPIKSYLDEIDFIFVGNTSVILDAVIANIPVCYFFPGSNAVYDYYGLVAEIKCPIIERADDFYKAFDFYGIS